MAVRDDRGDVKQTTTGFRGPLMVQSLTSAKSKFLSLKYLFYFLDMSEKRKKPIQRDVRPFYDINLAKKLLGNYIEKNIKKGWEKI